MPFGAIPKQDFNNREQEISYLRQVALPRRGPVGGNVLCQGPRGIGKSELLKQFHRVLFWEEEDVIPFYYRFHGASLKGSSFARDYFMRFVRQFVAHLKRDPAIADDMGTPLHRLVTVPAGLPLRFLPNLLADFEDHMEHGDLNSQVLAALNAPVTTASRAGRRLVIMLDDFHLAAGLYEQSPGDSPGLAGLFEISMKSELCPHVLTGSPREALDRIFTDDAFRGQAERLMLGPLPEDAAFNMLHTAAERLGVDVTEECRPLMRHLAGTPLYIRNLARALWRLQRSRAGQADFRECYAHEVADGEIAFYWWSVLRGAIEEPDRRRLALEVLRQSLDIPLAVRDLHRLARGFDTQESSLRDVLRDLESSGMVRAAGDVRPPEDPVLEDFIRAAHLRETEGQEMERVREAVIAHRFTPGATAEPPFEMVLPMGPDAELVAARALGQICDRMHLKREVTEQLQFAVIEACINAMEHSGSYEKRVFFKVSPEPSRLVITVESPGRAFEAEEATQPDKHEPPAGRTRGWGLQLMRRLMDEVRVERAHDRTRLVLIKQIVPEEVTS